MPLSHSDSLLTTVSQDSGITSPSPRAESEHHNLHTAPALTAPSLPAEEGHQCCRASQWEKGI